MLYSYGICHTVIRTTNSWVVRHSKVEWGSLLLHPYDVSQCNNLYNDFTILLVTGVV